MFLSKIHFEMEEVIHSKAICLQDILKDAFSIFSAVCQSKNGKDMFFADTWPSGSAATDECS